MAALSRFLRFDVEITVEERDGYFAAFTQPFAITAYGDTATAAEERAMEAMNLLVKRHSHTPEELSEHLGRFGIKHLMGIRPVATKYHNPVVHECKRELLVEVPAVA